MWLRRLPHTIARKATDLKQHIARRRLTVGFVVLCCILLAGLIWMIFRYLRVESRTIVINLVGTPLARADLNFARKQNGEEITVDLSLDARDVEPDKRGFAVSVPVAFERTDSFCEAVRQFAPFEKQSMRVYPFQVAESQHASCDLTFRGSVLSTSARELDLDLDIVRFTQSMFPVNVQIRDLDKVDISELSPPPSFQSAYIIQYEPLKPGPGGDATISMETRNREAAARGDFVIVWSGIFIGVFCSFLASVVYEWLKSADQRLNQKKRQTGVLP